MPPPTRPSFIRYFLTSAVLDPVTIVYLGGVIALMGVVAHWWEPLAGLAGITVHTVFVLLLSVYRELHKARVQLVEVHELVNSKSDEQAARIDQLTRALTGAGEMVPDDPAVHRD